MSKFHYILDNGHGGVVDGQYVTAPSKMYKHENGPTVYEGLFNRQVVGKMAMLLNKHNIDFTLLVPEAEDVPLKERVSRINDLHKKYEGKTILISVHGNAGGGTGFEVYTTKGQTASDTVAEIYIEEMAKEFPAKRARVDITDGDKDKEANFTILMCKGPAILTESFFMDKLEDAALMTSDAGQNKIALAHVNTILRVDALGKLENPKKKAEPKKKVEPKKKK